MKKKYEVNLIPVCTTNTIIIEAESIEAAIKIALDTTDGDKETYFDEWAENGHTAIEID